MASEDPFLRRYRRFLIVFVLVAATLAAGLGFWKLWQGDGFAAFLALLCVGFFVLLAHGYRRDEEERSR